MPVLVMVQLGAYWKPPEAIAGQVSVMMAADAVGVVPVVSVTDPLVPVLPATRALVGEPPAPAPAVGVGAVAFEADGEYLVPFHE